MSLRRRLAVRALVACLCSASLFAAAPAAAQDAAPTVAQRLVTLSGREEPPVGDARVVAAQKQLDKVVKRTGETPESIASACVRTARHLFDAGKIPATPLELLEVLDLHAVAGQPITEPLHRYVAARKTAPTRAHGEAMAALGGKR